MCLHVEPSRKKAGYGTVFARKLAFSDESQLDHDNSPRFSQNVTLSVLSRTGPGGQPVKGEVSPSSLKQKAFHAMIVECWACDLIIIGGHRWKSQPRVRPR